MGRPVMGTYRSTSIRFPPRYRSTYHCLVSMFRYEGVRGLYSGFSACILTDCMFSAFQFLVYEKLKSEYRRTRCLMFSDSQQDTASKSLVPSPVLPDLPVHVTLSLGAVAGGISAAITNPLDVVTTRLMALGQVDAAGQHVPMRTCFSQIISREGPSALWRGTIPRVCSIAPLAGLTFVAYEAVKRMLC